MRASDPEQLADYALKERDELSFVAAAPRRLLEEMPAPGDGLSGTERRSLQSIAAGARTPLAAFVAEQALEPAPFLGDAWFFRTLAELGRGQDRLVETEQGEELPLAPPLGDGQQYNVPLRLTSMGERVLRGEADRVELLGVDRWVGGTHVSREAAWRWDPAESRLLAPR